jgi:GAF domain-containing protein
LGERTKAATLRDGDRSLVECFLRLRGADLTTFMREFAQTVRRALGVEYCEILELLPEEDRLVLRAGAGFEEDLLGRATVGTRTESQAGYALISDGLAVVEDQRSEERFAPTPLLAERGIVSGACVAIRVGGRDYGVLGVHATSPRRFAEEELGFLENAAGFASMALERFLSEENSRRSLERERQRASAAEERLEFLREVKEVLSAAPDVPSALAAAARMAVGEGVSSRVAEARPYEDGWLQLEWRPYERKDGGVSLRGPYWYFRYHEGGRQKKLYVGKTDDPEANLKEKLAALGRARNGGAG